MTFRDVEQLFSFLPELVSSRTALRDQLSTDQRVATQKLKPKVIWRDSRSGIMKNGADTLHGCQACHASRRRNCFATLSAKLKVKKENKKKEKLNLLRFFISYGAMHICFPTSQFLSVVDAKFRSWNEDFSIVTRVTGYETLQVSKALTKVLQFMLNVLGQCTIFCFTFAHYS